MPVILKNKYNPNPITKFLITFLLALTVVNPIKIEAECAVVLIITSLFFVNGLKKESITWIITFGILLYLPQFPKTYSLNPIIKMFLTLPIIFRMFILAFMAASFMLKTSDVGTIISSMDKLKFSKNISIPVAVMFRFFPSFKQERKNIKIAMKIRGISFKNPIKYLEYVTIPLLIISSNIADDIAMAAETKAIANPIKKMRYIPINLQKIDFIYLFSILVLTIGGWLW